MVPFNNKKKDSCKYSKPREGHFKGLTGLRKSMVTYCAAILGQTNVKKNTHTHTHKRKKNNNKKKQEKVK